MLPAALIWQATSCLCFLPPPPTPTLGSWWFKVQRRKENVSLYVCYVIRHDTVLSSVGQFFICVPYLKTFKGQTLGLSFLLKGTLAGWILQLCDKNRALFLGHPAATQHREFVCVCKPYLYQPISPLRMHTHIEASPGTMLYMHLSTYCLSHTHTVCVQAHRLSAA